MAKARLSALLEDASGKLGRDYIARGRSGLVVRKKACYTFPSSPAFAAAGGRLKQANAVWNTLSMEQAAAWADYAATIVRSGRVSGRSYSPTGKNAFVGLAVKVLQVDPMAEVPTSPPVGGYVGDDVVVVTRAEGGLVFEASGPNRPGSVTELLVQRLVNERRRPDGDYKSMGFVAFSPGHLAHTLPVEPGVYACGYRFVEAATGRMTEAWLTGVRIVPEARVGRRRAA
ncbi:MAG: hypothetical protein JST30_12260 [Armatimonadetes bacterium]|nr:hypothetical protein [Armatimonadota bacterium]